VSASAEHVLFISGAGLQPWIWDETTKALAASREAAVAERPQHDDATLDDYVTAALRSAPWERFSIVAHSVGGVVGARLAQRAPDRVSSFLAVSAVIPRAGASFVTSMPFPNRLVLSLAMKISGTRPPESTIRRGLASGVDTGTADRIVREFVPESQRLYRDKIDQLSLPARRGYLFTSNDKELPSAWQRRLAGNLEPSWEQSLDTGHLPMLEAPEELAAAIRSFGDQSA
jgi:pimeloyl-ACP methyl ester carboxylesterase